MKLGVGSKFRPPPNSGQRRVRKSCRWADIIPLICSGITPGLISSDTMSMQYGTVCAGTVKKKKLLFTPRASCVAV
jgi:hypothetical protein